MKILDTNIAADLRDRDQVTRDRLSSLGKLPVISVFSRIELEAGVERHPEFSEARRRLLEIMLQTIAVVELTDADILAYGSIVRAAGYNRTRVFDRLIAAQAIVRRAPLITRNPRDFADIPDLDLVPW